MEQCDDSIVGMTTARHQLLQDIASTAVVGGSRNISCKGGRSAKGGKYPPVPVGHFQLQSSRRRGACMGWVPATWCSQLPPPPPYPAPSHSTHELLAPAAHEKIPDTLHLACAASTSASSASSIDEHTPQHLLQHGSTATKHSSMSPEVVTDQVCDSESSDLMAKLSMAESHEAAITALAGRVRHLSFDSAGCRAVQLALEVANLKCAEGLAVELRGHVYSAITSPHANYVVQKIIEVLPAKSCGFVAQELLGAARQAARHRYACRILCRLIEHHAGGVNADEGTEALIEEILNSINELCRNNYGHHVVNSVIENGPPIQRLKIAKAIHADMFGLARNRNASYVIGRALSYCDATEKRLLVNELLEGPEGLVPLAWSQYGCCVVRALLRMPTEYSQAGWEQLESAAVELHLSKYGRRLLEEFQITPQGGHARTVGNRPEG